MTDEERRAEDQPTAMVDAFIEGTLPEVDRRTASALSDLPVGARAEWTKTSAGEMWAVWPTPNQSGHGKTVDRAIRMIGSTVEKNPSGGFTYRDASGDEIPAE